MRNKFSIYWNRVMGIAFDAWEDKCITIVEYRLAERRFLNEINRNKVRCWQEFVDENRKKLGPDGIPAKVYQPVFHHPARHSARRIQRLSEKGYTFKSNPKLPAAYRYVCLIWPAKCSKSPLEVDSPK